MKRVMCALVAFVWTAGVWAGGTNNVPSKVKPVKSTEEARQRLEKIIIPELNVREASLSDFITLLEEKTFQASGKNFNCVVQAPSDVKVTMNLKNVSLTDVLQYATHAVGLAYRIEPHAVLIYKPESPQPSPAGKNAKP